MTKDFFKEGQKLRRPEYRKGVFIRVTGVGETTFLGITSTKQTEFQFSMSGDWLEIK